MARYVLFVLKVPLNPNQPLRAISASSEEASDVPAMQAMPERNDAKKQPVAPLTDQVTGGPGASD